MTSSVTIDQRFTEGFNEALALRDEDKLGECEQKANALLEDPAIPHYHRMKTLVLLGSVVEDWYVAERCYRRAEFLWQTLRRWHPVDSNAMVEEALAEIRLSLDDLKTVLDDERVDVIAHEEEIEAMLEAHDRAVADPSSLASDDEYFGMCDKME